MSTYLNRQVSGQVKVTFYIGRLSTIPLRKFYASQSRNCLQLVKGRIWSGSVK
uniref:Uncharacterized protein n=1 Tax=Anguilla anguilla TaxID=7936 RepID=A0A0E9U395_ANGAN